MVRRTKSDALETRARIIDAAEQVFHRKGVLSASLNDIATEAGVTRGAIYWHFKNKHDVFTAMVERGRLLFDMMSEKAEDPAEPDPLGKLTEFMVYLLQVVVNDPAQQRIFDIMFLKCEFSGDNLALQKQQRDTCRQSSSRMGRVLDNAIRCRQLPDTLDVPRAVVWLHSQLTGMIMFWLLDPESVDLASEAEYFVGASVHGLQYSPCLQRNTSVD